MPAGLSIDHRFHVSIQHVFSTAEAAAAHIAVETGARRGKVVIATTW